MHTASPFMARHVKRTRAKRGVHASAQHRTGATPGHGKQKESVTVRARAAPTSPAPTAATTAPSPSVFVAALSPEELIREKQMEVMDTLTPWAETELLPMLKSPETNWQPQDYLPDPSSEEFMDRIVEIRDRTRELPDDLLVVLAGDLITEEALPTYMSMINTLSLVRDSTGSDPHPWAVWNRAWTAEENRHGDLLNKYLWVTGRVDMKMVERTTQILLGAGMNPGTDANPYLGFVYTSFQERATKVSHGNTGFHAKRAGDAVLAKICGTIAADEARHEKAYCKIVDKFFELDVDEAMLAYARMMRQQITMPAHMMDDCVHMDNNNERTLFADFSAVAENSGTYTAMDYADIADHLNKRWDVAELSGLSGEAAEAQEYVLKMPARIRKIAEKSYQRRKKAPKTAKFSWIYEREVGIW